MKPAFSVIIFTTLAGFSQGLITFIALATLLGMALDQGYVNAGLTLSLVLLGIGLISSFFHLGHPERAWRAITQWRTSWMSREVIVLPALMGVTGIWWLQAVTGTTVISPVVLALLTLVLTIALWVCTAMIYACLRFIQEWAHPATIAYYIVLGLASGIVLSAWLGSAQGKDDLLQLLTPAALALTLAAWFTRIWTLRRNAQIKHKSSLQSATGIRNPQLVQTSMGMTGGSYNTREFFHHATMQVLMQARWIGQVLGFALPLALMVLMTLTGSSTLLWTLAVLSQLMGLLADRWLFFAQAKHPQNLYYQVVS